MLLGDIKKLNETRAKLNQVDLKQQDKGMISSKSTPCITEGWLLQTSLYNWTNVVK